MSDDSNKPDFVMNPGEKETVLFMQMVFQLSSLATMLLGKTPHPETGKTVCDLEAAQILIDQLEMIEVKTKGNLNREEQQLLRQTLMTLRMAYVDAVKQPKPAPSLSEEKAAPSTPLESADSATVPEAESRKRFSKKY